MANALTATTSVVIKADPPTVWAALTDRDLVGKAFFGARVETDWRVGSPITFSGEWQGKSYEDKGRIVKIEPDRLLQFTHYSPLTGQPDVPENYHTVTFELAPREAGTRLTISQTNAATEEERTHSEANWSMVLGSIKELTER